MITPQVVSLSLWAKLRLYWLLTKPRLSVVVVFSAVMGALIGGGEGWWLWPLLLIGGYGVTGAANAFNQVIERETDGLMERTAMRPLPSGQLAVAEAVAAALGWTVIGVLALAFIRWEVAAIGVFALLMYVLAYTPLKRVGPVSVLIGAIPGALPPAIGYLASRLALDEWFWMLFGIQFLWQFPHFWIIAWISQADYERAGLRMLPFSDQKLNKLAILVGAVVLTFSGLLVGVFLGWGGMLWMGMLGIGITVLAYRFYRRSEQVRARQMLIGLTLFLTLFYMGLWIWSQG